MSEYAHQYEIETETCEKNKLPSHHVFNKQVQSCWNALQASRKLAVYQGLIQLTGSLKTAIMLSQLLYWTRVSTEVGERDGWLYKTIAEMEVETGLTKREQGLCKEKLYELNLIRTCRVGVGARLAFKVNLDELALGICRLYDCNPESIPPLRVEDIHNSKTWVYRQFFTARFVYHRDLVHLTGCLNAAIMLSQLFNLASRNLLDANELKQHICSSIRIPEWESALGLSHKSQLNARNKLKNLGFIFEKNLQGDRRIFTFINAKTILNALGDKIKPKQTLATHPPQRVQRVKALYNKVANTPIIQKFPMGDNPNVISDDVADKKGKMADLKREEWENQKGKNEQPRGFQGGLATFQSEYKMCMILPISEVTKGRIQKLQNGKFRSNEWRSSEVTKGGILTYNNNYINNNYNYKYGVLPSNFGEQHANSSVVVVVDETSSPKTVKEKTKQATQPNLIMPSCFTGIEEQQAWQIVHTQLSDMPTVRVQEILDEIAAQGKNKVSSPLGLLGKLISLARSGTLVCTKAHQVREQRENAVKQVNSLTTPTNNIINVDEWINLPQGTQFFDQDGNVFIKERTGMLHCREKRSNILQCFVSQLLKEGKLTLQCPTP